MLPSRMTGVLLVGHGGLDQLVYRDDLPMPTPGAGEVLVRVRASSVNNTDVNTRIGSNRPSVPAAVPEEGGPHGADAERGGRPVQEERIAFGFPRIQGLSVVGEVVGVGAGVSRDRIGDRVVVDPVVRDEDLPAWGRAVAVVGNKTDGGYAQFAVVPSGNARRVRSSLSDVELACVPGPYNAAEEMLVRIGLGAGEIVLVTGASGGVGSALIELARLRGARVAAVTGTAKEDAVRSLGAEWIIPREADDLGAAVAQTIGDAGPVDAVADVLGSALTPTLLHVLRLGGRYVTPGAMAGPSTTIDLRDLIHKDLLMIGVGHSGADTFSNLIRYIDDGRLRPRVDRVFPLTRLREAQEYFLQKAHVGNVAIEIP